MTNCIFVGASNTAVEGQHINFQLLVAVAIIPAVTTQAPPDPSIERDVRPFCLHVVEIIQNALSRRRLELVCLINSVSVQPFFFQKIPRLCALRTESAVEQMSRTPSIAVTRSASAGRSAAEGQSVRWTLRSPVKPRKISSASRGCNGAITRTCMRRVIPRGKECDLATGLRNGAKCADQRRECAGGGSLKLQKR